MGAFDQYNRVSNFPTYKVVWEPYKKWIGQKKLVSWIGIYNGKLYGRQPYVDIEHGTKNDKGEEVAHVRVTLPKWMLDDVEKMMHDEAVMKEIKDGIVYAEFESVKTKSGNSTCRVHWIEDDKMPF